MNLNSSKIFYKILKGLNDMPLKDLMAMQGYYDLLSQISVSMVRKDETIFPYFKSVEDGTTGCTNGKSVFINTWSPMTLSVERFAEILDGKDEDKPNWLSQLPSNINVQQYSYLVNVGLTVHEFAHVLYTNFYGLAKLRKELSEGNFTSCNNKEKLERVFGSKFKNSLINNIKFLTNAVEDGYIENCLALEYPSNGTVVRGLQATREMLFFSSPSLYDMESKVMKGKIDIPTLFCNLLLLQVRGFTPKDIEKCSGVLHELLMEALEKAKSYVDDYLKSSQKHNEDIFALIDIMVDLYPDFKESDDEEGGEEKQSSNPQINDNSDAEVSSKTDEKSPSIRDTQNPTDEETDAERKQMAINDDELDNSSSRSPLRNPTSELDKEELEDKQKEVDKAFENAKNDNSSSSNDGLNEMAKQLAEKEIAQNQCNNLTKNFKENEDYFVRSRANVVNTQQHPCKKGDQETYKAIYKELEPTIKACVRRIKQVLKKRAFDDEETGFSSGQKLVSRELYRQDRKVFSKDLVPDDTPDVAFTIMVDESGSMYGEKIVTARNTAILFDAVARELEIPTRIVGHDETYDIVNVYNYRNFVSNNKEKFSLVNIEARSGNIDTMVLTGLCEEMLKREEKSKVVIVISDGLPCGLDDNIIKDNFKGVPLKILNSDDVRYREDYDMQELNACVRYYRKKGIKIIGVAIDEKDGIKAIYEEGTLDCTDLNRLPIEMLKLFKKYVLK